MHALLMWLDNNNKRHYGRVINIVDSTLTGISAPQAPVFRQGDRRGL